MSFRFFLRFALAWLLAVPAPAAGAPEPGPADGQAPVEKAPPARKRTGVTLAQENAARDAFNTGLSLFDAGDKAQALIEFQRAQELAPRPGNLLMIAHCEYHLGSLKEARAHYQAFLALEPRGQFAETARQRIDAINRRKGLIVIQAAPLGVDILIDRLDGPRQVVTGQAPNQFPVPAGRWRVTARKPRYRSQSVEVEIDSVDTKPLFFALESDLARLEIKTHPPNATLYVRGNRARNPYLQDVEPGAYEIYAEAPNYESRTETYVLSPGERRPVWFPLNYQQRSGRPELIGFWTVAGALGGGGLVLAWLTSQNRLEANAEAVTASATVLTGAALTGGAIGALGATAFLPQYLPDNKALLRIGSAWVGAAEGATLALTLRPTLSSAWVGGGVGLGLGAVAGTLLEHRAPNYGRVALIQSGAAVGLLAGALAVPALGLGDRDERSLAVFAGLNLGLASGLALAYLPDQREYGPSWQRVLLVDLAIGAGTLAGALVKIIGRCVQEAPGEPCSFTSDPKTAPAGADRARERRLTARFALAGGGLGLAVGWLLTSAQDQRSARLGAPGSLAWMRTLLPKPTMLPVTSSDGGTSLVPGFGAQGRF